MITNMRIDKDDIIKFDKYKNNYLNTAFPPTSRTNSNAKAITGTNKILE